MNKTEAILHAAVRYTAACVEGSVKGILYKYDATGDYEFLSPQDVEGLKEAGKDIPESVSLDEYITSEALADPKFTVGGDGRSLRSASIIVTWRDPTVRITTKGVRGSWAGETAEWGFSAEAAAALTEYFTSLWDSIKQSH